jgi:hypothetical protein
MELMADRIIEGGKAGLAYRQAASAPESSEASTLLGNGCTARVRKLRDTLAALKERYVGLWNRENRPFALDVVTQRFDAAMMMFAVLCYQLEDADVTAALRTARSEAVTRGRKVRLFLNLKTGRYRLEGSTREGTLTGMSMTDAGLVWQNPEKSQGYIVFFGDGSSSGGKLGLVEPTGRRYLLQVEPITGKVSLGSAVK